MKNPGFPRGFLYIRTRLSRDKKKKGNAVLPFSAAFQPAFFRIFFIRSWLRTVFSSFFSIFLRRPTVIPDNSIYFSSFPQPASSSPARGAENILPRRTANRQSSCRAFISSVIFRNSSAVNKSKNIIPVCRR